MGGWDGDRFLPSVLIVHSPAEQIGAAATHSSQSQPQPQIWVKHINLVAVLAKIFSPMFCCVAEI